MKSHRIVILLSIVLAIPSLCFAQGGKEALIGAWKLISFEGIAPGNKITPFGTNPVGLIIYHPTGYMSVQFMGDKRPTFASGHPASASPEETKGAFLTYYSYFGTYEVNEKDGFVIQHVQCSLNPLEVGNDHKRTFKISGDRLTLITLPQRGADGLMYTYDVTYEKIK
jgi:hypothetical protein